MHLRYSSAPLVILLVHLTNRSIWCVCVCVCVRYGPATQVRWLQDPKPADKAAAAVAKRPAPTQPPRLVYWYMELMLSEVSTLGGSHINPYIEGRSTGEGT